MKGYIRVNISKISGRTIVPNLRFPYCTFFTDNERYNDKCTRILQYMYVYTRHGIIAYIDETHVDLQAYIYCTCIMFAIVGARRSTDKS